MLQLLGDDAGLAIELWLTDNVDVRPIYFPAVDLMVVLLLQFAWDNGCW